MLELELEVPRRVVSDGGIGVNVLRGTGIGHRVREALVVVEILKVVNLRGGVALAGGGVARCRGSAAAIEFANEQIKLQFDRNNRGQATLGKALHHALEHITRIGGEHAERKSRRMNSSN